LGCVPYAIFLRIILVGVFLRGNLIFESFSKPEGDELVNSFYPLSHEQTHNRRNIILKISNITTKSLTKERKKIE